MLPQEPPIPCECLPLCLDTFAWYLGKIQVLSLVGQHFTGRALLPALLFPSKQVLCWHLTESALLFSKDTAPHRLVKRSSYGNTLTRTSYFHLHYSSHVFKNTAKLLEFGIGNPRSCQDSRIFCRKESKLGAGEMVQSSGELVKLIEDPAMIPSTHKEAYKHS